MAKRIKATKVRGEKVRQRRPRGSGAYPGIPLRLPPEMVAAIDAWAETADTTRSGAIRQWIEAGLKRRPKP
jgi:hypothetical protein